MTAFQPCTLNNAPEANAGLDATNRFLAENQNELAALPKTLG